MLKNQNKYDRKTWWARTLGFTVAIIGSCAGYNSDSWALFGLNIGIAGYWVGNLVSGEQAKKFRIIDTAFQNYQSQVIKTLLSDISPEDAKKKVKKLSDEYIAWSKSTDNPGRK